MKKLATIFAALFFCTAALAQNTGNVPNNAFAIGQGPTKSGFKSILCTAGQLPVGQAAAPICQTVSGDATFSAGGALTLATVNGTPGTFGSATQCAAFTVNGKGLITASSQALCTPAIGSVTGLGTSVATALAVNVGTPGAFVVNGGAGGTPSSLTLTNATGLPIAGIAGLGTGVPAALAVNIGSAGAPVLFNGAGGTPSSLTLTNASGLPVGTGVSGLGTGVATALGVNVGSAGSFARTIANGTAALGTSAIAAGACASAVTVAATGVATTDLVDAGFNGDPTAVTGYVAPNMLSIIPYPTSNNVNFKVCNNTAASITPGAITLNWAVRR
jgi:hypothetical protein